MRQYLTYNNEPVILILGLRLLFLTHEQNVCKYDDLGQYTTFFQTVWILLDCEPQYSGMDQKFPVLLEF